MDADAALSAQHYNAPVLIVDADTHVDETEATWEHLCGADERFRPKVLDFAGAPSFVVDDARPHRLWQLDGKFRLRRWRDDKRTGTTKETRELIDVPARLRHMDELGVDVQVLYTTFFLTAITDRPEMELALTRAYNHWLAGRTAESKGRLRWVAVLPLLSIDKAVEELRFAVDHGACGVFKMGVECGGRAASDPYFYPVYEEAERLNVPICFHTSSGDPHRDVAASARANPNELQLNAISAFGSLVVNGVPDLFPKLRFGWIEASSSWVPYLMHDLEAKRARLTALQGFDFKKDLFREYRFYVTCDTMDDLPYILNYGVEDALMVGSDYSHADQSAELDAIRRIRTMGSEGRIPDRVAQKIVSDNPLKFYGLA
jgi:predicted TIM-barrel fold metal-dependent hydrolase